MIRIYVPFFTWGFGGTIEEDSEPVQDAAISQEQEATASEDVVVRS